MKRISKDRYYLNIAREVAARSTCLRRNYGCIVVKNDEIIATGYNGAARGDVNCCDVYETCPRAHMAHNSGDYSDCPAVHAEQNAMLSARRSEMIGATMYLFGYEHMPDGTKQDIPVCTPCPVCARIISNSGITRIVAPQDVQDD